MTAPWRPDARPVAPEPAPGIGWMLLLSLWLLPVLAGMGRVTWLGFAVVGILTVRVSWLVSAGVYAAAAALLPLLPDDTAANVGFVIVWIVGIVHALIVNPGWLRLAWSRRVRGERLLGRAPRDAAPSGPAPAPAAGPRVVEPATASAPPALAAPLFAPPPPPAPPAAGAAGIDPQSAPAAVLAALPYMGPARADYLAAARATRPMATLDDLIEVLALQPHEAAAMRPFLAFAPPPPPAAAPPRTPGGRILDV